MKKGVALTTPLAAPFKALTGFYYYLKDNRCPLKLTVIFLSFFTAVRIPTMIVAIKEPKLIISPNASATDKRLLLSKE